MAAPPIIKRARIWGYILLGMLGASALVMIVGIALMLFVFAAGDSWIEKNAESIMYLPIATCGVLFLATLDLISRYGVRINDQAGHSIVTAGIGIFIAQFLGVIALDLLAAEQAPFLDRWQDIWVGIGISILAMLGSLGIYFFPLLMFAPAVASGMNLIAPPSTSRLLFVISTGAVFGAANGLAGYVISEIV